MMKFVVIVLLLAWTDVSLVSGHAVPQNCSARYQSALREALEIKNECGDAAAYDCCQVNCNFKTTTVCEDLQIIVQKCLRRTRYCIQTLIYSSAVQNYSIMHQPLRSLQTVYLTMRIHVCLAFTIPHAY